MTTSSHTHYQREMISKIFLLWLSVLVDGVLGVRPACDIPPTDLNQLATITCYLPEKVLQDKHGFRVTHLTRNNTVVNAEWEDGQYMFSLEVDISMDGQTKNDRFTFKMYPVTRNRTGIYACIPEGYKQEEVGTCTLSLKSEQSRPTDIPHVGTVNENEYTNQAEYIVLVAACCILTAIIVIGLIGISIYIHRNKRKEQDHRNTVLGPEELKTFLNGHTKDICGPEESKTFLNGHTKDICGMANGHN